MTYYIYEVPGNKVGATHQWQKRRDYNFNHYQIEPIIIETIEGPNTEEFWQVVGDREWELADVNGYDRGTHYRVICIRASKGGLKNVESGHLQSIRTFENMSKGGTKTLNGIHSKRIASLGGKAKRILTFEEAQEIRSKYVPHRYTATMLSKEYGVRKQVIARIVAGNTYATP